MRICTTYNIHCLHNYSLYNIQYTLPTMHSRAPIFLSRLLFFGSRDVFFGAGCGKKGTTSPMAWVKKKKGGLWFRKKKGYRFPHGLVRVLAHGAL